MNKSVKFSSNHFYSIIEHIFISDQIASFDENIIKKNNINCLINCTKNAPFLFNNTINIHLHFLNTTEKYNNNELIRKTNKIVDYIHKLIKDSNNILIYCENGSNKSLIILFCYLLKYPVNRPSFSSYYTPNLNQIIEFINSKFDYDILSECNDLTICKIYRNNIMDSMWQSCSLESNNEISLSKIKVENSTFKIMNFTNLFLSKKPLKPLLTK